MRFIEKYIFRILGLFLLVIMLAAITWGAVSISLSEMYTGSVHFLQGKGTSNIYEAVFIQLRLPRVMLCAITGAILAASGVLMQGLFRNPLVEPGIIGTSAGAAFGASVLFVFAAKLSVELKAFVGAFLVPIGAFIGALLCTYIVYVLSKNMKRVPVMYLLLIGIAINSIGLSGTGFMSYLARDPQARSITFWNLGTFSGASWIQVGILGCIAVVCIWISFRHAKQLNALLLGEDEAAYLGVNTNKLKKNILLINALMISVATAFVGVISFVGLIVPHILRLVLGSDNKKILPASILLGAALLTLTDMAARLLLAPAELPIGILTSVIGAPVFIFLLKKISRNNDKGGYYA
jgi:iron complex transport system permease protein